MMFPGLHPMAMMSTSNMGFTSRGSAGFPGGMYGAGPAPYPSMYQSSVPAAQSGGAQGGDTQVIFALCFRLSLSFGKVAAKYSICIKLTASGMHMV